LPSSIFLALMGLPQSDLPMFLQWRDDTIRPDTDDPDEAARKRDRVGTEITEYFKQSLADRRANPDDRLLCRIAVAEVEGRELTEEERLGISHLLMLGGLDTVTATLDCMVAHFARDPDRRRQLVEDPSLVPAVVEELLRYETPVALIVRVVKQDCELGGVRLRAGDHATLLIGACNVDPAQFADAEAPDFATGSAADDFYGANRIGDNLFANSIVALEARTGKRRWHFQVVRHDVWDRDLPAPPVLATVTRDGRAVDAVVQITKSGHVFVLDRDTGKPLFPLEEVPIEASEIPGEQLARSQILPRLPKPFSRQVFDASLITDRTPEATAHVEAALEDMTTGGQFIPPSMHAQVVFPGFDGGGEWGGPAFDPETRLLYVNANEMPWILKLDEKQPLPAGADAARVYSTLCASCHGDDRKGSGEFPGLENLGERMTHDAFTSLLQTGRGRMPAFEAHFDWQGLNAMASYLLYGKNTSIDSALGANSPLFLRYRIDGYPLFTDHEGYPAVKPPWGTLSAIDLDSGDFAWQVPLGEYPELVAQGLRNTGSQNYGGPVVTAGGLVFVAATLFDRKIRAFDKATGERLWEHELPAAGVATPAVYEVNGRQFVVIAAGGGKFGGPQSGKYVAFSLPAATEDAPEQRRTRWGGFRK
jgi:outer membrane protein assembly factor BamB